MIRLLLLPVLASGCATLDTLLYNPVPCSTVGPATCDDVEEPFDKICVPCDEPYDWGRTYDWIPGTLAEGESVRPIPSSAVTQITIDTDDGEGSLDAYFIASHGDDKLLADVTVVYNHGRYAGIEHYQPRVRFLYEGGYNVLVWDYRGFGKSLPEAPPSPDQQEADARLVMERAATLAPDPTRIVPYGYSAGAVPASSMRDLGECMIVFEAPFLKLANFSVAGTRLSLGEQFFSTGQLDVVAKMEGYDKPIFAMIGTEDEVVPGVENASEVIETTSAGAELWVVEGASHGVAGGGIPEDVGLTTYLDRLRSNVSAGCPGSE